MAKVQCSISLMSVGADEVGGLDIACKFHCFTRQVALEIASAQVH